MNFNIKYSAVLFSKENKALKNISADIEFYSVQNNQWTILTTSKTNALGIFTANFEIPNRITKNNERVRAIRDIVSSGGIPMFRMVINSSSNKKQILGNVSKINIDNEKLEIGVGFGKIWMLPKEKWVKIEDDLFITSNHYDNEEELILCNTRLFQLEKENKDIKKLNKELVEKNKNLDIKVSSLTDEIKGYELRINEKEHEISQIRDFVFQLEEELNKLKSNNKDLEKKSKNLIEDKIVLSNKINKLTISLKEKEDKLLQCKNDFNEKEAEIKKLQEEVKLLKDKLAECHSLKLKLETETSNWKNDSKNRKEQYESLSNAFNEKEKVLEKIQNDLNGVVEDRLQIEKQLEDALSYNKNENPNKVESNVVYGHLASELKSANDAMIGTNYKLENVKLNIKALVNKSPTGLNFELIDSLSSKEINEAAISTIEVEVNMNEPENIEYIEELVPNVVGLTETAVRKKLNKYGLKLKPAYQKKEIRSENIVGQSFKQIPEAGVNTYSGEVITVFFTKK